MFKLTSKEAMYFSWHTNGVQDNTGELNELIKQGWRTASEVAPSAPGGAFTGGERFVLILLER